MGSRFSLIVDTLYEIQSPSERVEELRRILQDHSVRSWIEAEAKELDLPLRVKPCQNNKKRKRKSKKPDCLWVVEWQPDPVIVENWSRNNSVFWDFETWISSAQDDEDSHMFKHASLLATIIVSFATQRRFLRLIIYDWVISHTAGTNIILETCLSVAQASYGSSGEQLLGDASYVQQEAQAGRQYHDLAETHGVGMLFGIPPGLDPVITSVGGRHYKTANGAITHLRLTERFEHLNELAKSIRTTSLTLFRELPSSFCRLLVSQHPGRDGHCKDTLNGILQGANRHTQAQSSSSCATGQQNQAANPEDYGNSRSSPILDDSPQCASCSTSTQPGLVVGNINQDISWNLQAQDSRADPQQPSLDDLILNANNNVPLPPSLNEPSLDDGFVPLPPGLDEPSLDDLLRRANHFVPLPPGLDEPSLDDLLRRANHFVPLQAGLNEPSLDSLALNANPYISLQPEIELNNVNQGGGGWDLRAHDSHPNTPGSDIPQAPSISQAFQQFTESTVLAPMERGNANWPDHAQYPQTQQEIY